MNVVPHLQIAGVLMMERSVQYVDQRETSTFYIMDTKRYMEINFNQLQQLTY